MFEKGGVKASTFTPKKRAERKETEREAGGNRYEYSFKARKRRRERVREPRMDKTHAQHKVKKQNTELQT